MKRYELMTKEECNTDCIFAYDKWMNEDVKSEKKRRCDAYTTVEEINNHYNDYCNNMSCDKCKHNSDIYKCSLGYALEEVEFINGREICQEHFTNNDYITEVNRFLDRLTASEGYVSVSELAERFNKIDEYFGRGSWNLLQILANINIIVPINLHKEQLERADNNEKI